MYCKSSFRYTIRKLFRVTNDRQYRTFRLEPGGRSTGIPLPSTLWLLITIYSFKSESLHSRKLCFEKAANTSSPFPFPSPSPCQQVAEMKQSSYPLLKSLIRISPRSPVTSNSLSRIVIWSQSTELSHPINVSIWNLWSDVTTLSFYISL
jgi:hypothetical protein